MSKKKTNKEFKNEVYRLVKKEYVFIEEYITNLTKIKVTHNKCGNTYDVAPIKFLLGRRCPYCAGNKKLVTEDFALYVKEKTNNEYILKDKYINSNTKIKILHKKCNKIFEITPANFKSGYRCSHCYKSKKKTQEEFVNEVKELTNNKYLVVGNYINNKTKIKMKHIVCNNFFEVRPNDFLSNGNRCPYCFGLPHNSMKSQVIKEFLIKEDIEFNSEVSFNDLYNEKKLLFDFAIYKRGKLICLLEFDGKQHFFPIFSKYDSEQAVSNFNKQQKRDKLKNEYCKKNKIPLIRIKYNDSRKLFQKKLDEIRKMYTSFK